MSRSVSCAVSDYVEADLGWEESIYQSRGIQFNAYQLCSADRATIVGAIKHADVLVVDRLEVNVALLNLLPCCQAIIRHGDGYDNVDCEAATDLGIIVCNRPGFWSSEMATQAFVMALALLRGLGTQQSLIREENLEQGFYRRLGAQTRLDKATIGVVGLGRTGREAAKLFAPIVRRVVAFDPIYDQAKLDVDVAPATLVSWDWLLANSDCVSLHLPALFDGKPLISRKELWSMREQACLVNCARGSLVDLDALADALLEGRLSGAALDTIGPRRLHPSHPLWTHPNVIITPHLAWYSEDALWAMRRSIVEDIINIAAGILPRYIVNKEVLAQKQLRFNVDRQKNL